jgi:hypothetical protein
MAKDARLDLGRYITNPFNRNGFSNKKLSFDDLFSSKPESGNPPWVPSRFNEKDLLNRVMTKKLNLNPDLNFVSNSPFFDDNSKTNEHYDMFGLGTFNRPDDYDFNEGRALTAQRPQEQPDFNPEWVEAYKLSPTLNPQKAAKNPMPRMRNPDPHGFLMATAEKQVKSEVENTPSVADLLKRKEEVTKDQEETQGTKISAEEQKQPISPTQV